MVTSVQPTRVSPETIRTPAARVFVGASRVRLRVVAGERIMSGLPAILRQLNFVETTDGRLAGSSELREVWLIDGALDEALDLCRSLPDGNARILASETSSFTERRRCADAGADVMITAPIDPRELAAWIEHFDDHSGARRATVLIVDDDELSAECLAALLAARGIDAEIVGDPTRVFDVLDRASFDLVLMDLEMPEVNGIDLARMIRQDHRHLSVPIVFLSAGGDTETQILARHFGGDDFISKRIDRGLLVRLVALRVERARVLRALIERDGLTGLVDHARLIERLGQELARSRRTGTVCTLALIDIDHFKVVNDTWGHQTGDFVLKRLASSLSEWLRRTDVVGRYGGEEFAALMLDTTAEQAAPVIDAFRRHFSALDLTAHGTTFHVTFSAGIADSRDSADAAAFVAASDEALYRAKREGRNRIVLAPTSARPEPHDRRSTGVPGTSAALSHSDLPLSDLANGGTR